MDTMRVGDVMELVDKVISRRYVRDASVVRYALVDGNHAIVNNATKIITMINQETGTWRDYPFAK